MNKANAPGLLVSVTSADEAQTALKAGADLIDVKDPARGPLGMAHHETAAAVLKVVKGKVPVSAALGEWSSNALTEAGWHLELPLQFVKWGLAKYSGDLGSGEELLETRRQVPPAIEVVLVAYADWEAAKSPPPAELVKLARRVRYKAFLFDTFDKKAKTLLDHIPLDELRGYVESLKRADIAVALGGSLKLEQVKKLKDLGADWLAVRGALCAGDNRTGMLDAVRIKKWKEALK